MAPPWPPAVKLVVRLLACFAAILGMGGMLSAVSLVHAGTPVEPIPSVADMIAEQLRKDPIYLSDHLPRAVSQDDLEGIRAAITRLPVRTFVVVTPVFAEPRGQIALLRDRLLADGIYLVVNERNTGVVRQFGGSLPVQDALMAAELELPVDASTHLLIERFVEVLLSGKASERRKAAARRLDEGHEPKRLHERPADVEARAFRLGALAGAVATLAAVLVVRTLTSPATPARRSRRRRRGS